MYLVISWKANGAPTARDGVKEVTLFLHFFFPASLFKIASVVFLHLHTIFKSNRIIKRDQCDRENLTIGEVKSPYQRFFGMMDNFNIMEVFNQYITSITAMIIEVYSQTEAKPNEWRFDVHAISNKAKKSRTKSNTEQ